MMTDIIGLTDSSQPCLLRLYKERNIVRERIDRCLIAMSPGPIHRLPPEMISEIFRHSLPQLCRPDPSAAPLSLCGVCSLWREITYTIHDLWSHLDFTSQLKPDLRPFINPTPGDFSLHSPLHQWIAHSRKFHLHLSFDHSDDEILPNLISSVLLPNVAQVFRLEILLQWRISDVPFQHFFVLPPHSMRSLKFLVLQGPSLGTVTVFQSSPSLTHLSLEDLKFAHDFYEYGDLPKLHPVFPWERLTHLSISRWIELEVWLSVLLLCPLLEVGLFSIDLRDQASRNIRDFGDSDDENENHICHGREFLAAVGPVTLVCLHELDLILVCGQSFSLRGVHFPALKSLRIHRGHTPVLMQQQVSRGANTVDQFSWRNSQTFLLELRSLEILSLVGNVGSVKEIMFLLHHTPNVDFLDLNLHLDYGDLFCSLTVRSRSSLVPRLSCLRFLLEPDDMISYSEDASHNMVLSRSQPNSGMSMLIIVSSSFRKSHYEKVKKLAENARTYGRITFDVDAVSHRFIPYRRCTTQSLWRT